MDTRQALMCEPTEQQRGLALIADYERANAAYEATNAQGGDCTAEEQKEIERLAAEMDAAWDRMAAHIRGTEAQAE